jgi:tripartite-type tricarboxylate transporter receptor subunit TctC
VTELVLNPQIVKVPYDPVRDFSAVSPVAFGYYVLVVHPSLPAKSAKELIALAKTRPGEIN